MEEENCDSSSSSSSDGETSNEQAAKRIQDRLAKKRRDEDDGGDEDGFQRQREVNAWSNCGANGDEDDVEMAIENRKKASKGGLLRRVEMEVESFDMEESIPEDSGSSDYDFGCDYDLDFDEDFLIDFGDTGPHTSIKCEQESVASYESSKSYESYGNGDDDDDDDDDDDYDDDYDDSYDDEEEGEYQRMRPIQKPEDIFGPAFADTPFDSEYDEKWGDETLAGSISAKDHKNLSKTKNKGTSLPTKDSIAHEIQSEQELIELDIRKQRDMLVSTRDISNVLGSDLEGRQTNNAEDVKNFEEDPYEMEHYIPPTNNDGWICRFESWTPPPKEQSSTPDATSDALTENDTAETKEKASAVEVCSRRQEEPIPNGSDDVTIVDTEVGDISVHPKACNVQVKQSFWASEGNKTKQNVLVPLCCILSIIVIVVLVLIFGGR